MHIYTFNIKYMYVIFQAGGISVGVYETNSKGIFLCIFYQD